MGITNATVTGSIYTGILAGTNGGSVIASYTTGSVSGTTRVGGIIGYQGLNAASIHSSYSTASVSGTQYVGGVLGQKFGSVTNSYATGLVSRASGGASEIGGLIGSSSQGATTASYYDTTTSGCRTGGSNGCTGSPGGGTGHATAALKTPTGYTGIYSTWSANLDGVAGNDAPWAFGTSSDYPTLEYHLEVDYDLDNDNLIDVANLAQLNGMRYDRNGNGANEASGRYAETTTNFAVHSSAFPRRKARMGCPGSCRGYELVADLDFDSDGDGDVDANDHGGAYWNGGDGWTPIGDIGSTTAWRTTFRGNGHTINNLFINTPSDGDKGLFAQTWTEGRIESVGVTNANITATTWSAILLSTNNGNVVGCWTSGKIVGTDRVGGLVAFNSRNVLSSYSTAHVTGTNRVGGLVGHIANSGPRVFNSYSTGRVVRTGTGNTSTNFGGLIGHISGSATAGNTVNSYYDTSTSGCVAGGSDGCTRSFGGTGKTTRELQTVTDFTGIYANWNTQPGNAWTFGNNMQYPMLTYQSMNTAPQGGQAMGMSDNGSIPVVGERVGVCLTPDDFPNRAVVDGETYYVGWVWERSTDGVDWTAAVPLNSMGAPSGDPPAYNNPPTYEYSPTTDDVGSYLRARMELSDGSTAYTRNLGGRVAAPTASGATDGGTIPFVRNYVAPLVGFEIAVSEPIPEGAVDARVGWQRCPNNSAPHTDCVYIPDVWWIRYTPTTADIGSYLRMYVYYETSGGTWTRRVTPLTTSVVARP